MRGLLVSRRLYCPVTSDLNFSKPTQRLVARDFSLSLFLSIDPTCTTDLYPKIFKPLTIRAMLSAASSTQPSNFSADTKLKFLNIFVYM